jgi:hypothetical protein
VTETDFPRCNGGPGPAANANPLSLGSRSAKLKGVKTFDTGLAALRRLDEISPSYREGPFGSGSLFAKTLQKINNDRKTGQ